MAEPATQTPAEALLQACKDSWDEEYIPGLKNKNNCSGFAHSVAEKLDYPIPPGQADAIVDYISSNWTEVDSGILASQQASLGKLVIAGLKAADHTPVKNNGHVVVIVPGALYHGTYPKCWGGSIGTAQSQGDKSVGECWNRTDRDKVKYYQAK